MPGLVLLAAVTLAARTIAAIVTGSMSVYFLPPTITTVFVGLAFLVSVVVVDRARGLGVAIVLWLGITVLYDAALVLVTTSLADYPLELPLLGLTLLNPVDLGRILLLLRLDAAALMGYTGAVFERFFGSVLGTGVTVGALALWVTAPLLLGLRRFASKDF